jgi:hypothetical protein
MPKFINELNQKVNIYAEIGGCSKVGVGPSGESEIDPKTPSRTDELEFVDYDPNKEVKVIIEQDKLPNNSKGDGFKYIFGKEMGSAPHHIGVKRKGSKFTLIIHYNNDKEDVDPKIKHPG